jgi:nucleotide-binding universal stress UspA family protein
MIEIRRILSPTDFSDMSRHALDHAAALARWYDSRLTLLYVHPAMTVATLTPGAPMLPGAILSPEDGAQIRHNLEEFARAEIGSGLPLECVFREGDPAATIVEMAAEEDVDLVVLGTHGRSGFERLAMGSVAEKVLRRAACPVLTVPPRAGDVVPVPATLFRHVLCAVDLSASSLRALDYAMSIAQEAGGELTVVHALELLPEDVGLESSWATRRSVAEHIASTRDERQAQLEAAIPAAVRDYCQVNLVMTSGKPYRDVLREAESRQSDLIVLGVHGRNPLDLLFFGSTTQQVVRRARCPVLTVRSA